MNIYISREGNQYGPFAAESLDEMLRAGNVLTTDLIFVEGQSGWVLVSDHLKQQQSSAPAEPPPLPSGAAGGLRLASKSTVAAPPVLGATAGASELEQQVLAGGRFVTYQYCISILVMTFKRPSPVVFLRGDEDGFVQAFTYSLISLVAGWWGIPWGPIWTLTTLVNNARGGTDLTHAVLADKLGPARAGQIMARRSPPAPRGSGMKLFRWALAGVGLMLVLGLMLTGLVALRSSSQESYGPAAAGKVEFEAANQQIAAYHGTVAFGNSPQAIAVASAFASLMKQGRNEFFEGGKEKGLSLSDHQFLTYCELHSSNCVLIVHVPELRRFTSRAKASMGTLAWISAQAVLRNQKAVPPGAQLAVGLRGFALYDRVLLGQMVARPGNADTGLVETDTSSRAERKLFPFFVQGNLQ